MRRTDRWTSFVYTERVDRELTEVKKGPSSSSGPFTAMQGYCTQDVLGCALAFSHNSLIAALMSLRAIYVAPPSSQV